MSSSSSRPREAAIAKLDVAKLRVEGRAAHASAVMQSYTLVRMMGRPGRWKDLNLDARSAWVSRYDEMELASGAELDSAVELGAAVEVDAIVELDTGVELDDDVKPNTTMLGNIRDGSN